MLEFYAWRHKLIACGGRNNEIPRCPSPTESARWIAVEGLHSSERGGDCQGQPSHLYSLRKVSVHSELTHQIIFAVDLSTTPVSLFVWYNCRTNVENSNIIFRLSKPLWATLQWKKVPSPPTCYSFHYWPHWRRVRALNQITKPVPTHRIWAAGQCQWLNKARRRGVLFVASLSVWQLGALR